MTVKASSKLFVFNPVGEVLLLKRSEHDRNRPGLFDLPGGGLDRDEDPIIGAVRETHEETGLVIDPDRLEYVGFSSAKSKFGHSNARYFYLAQIAEHRPVLYLDPHESQSAQWRPLEEAVPMLGHEIQQYMGNVLVQELTPQRELVTLSQPVLILAQRQELSLALYP